MFFLSGMTSRATYIAYSAYRPNLTHTHRLLFHMHFSLSVIPRASVDLEHEDFFKQI